MHEKTAKRPSAIDLVLIGLHALTLALYFLATNTLVTDRSIEIGLDHLIPFIPVSILIYHLWYPTLLLTGIGLYVKNRKAFRLCLLAMSVVYFSSIFCFVLFPTFVPRAALDQNSDNLFIKLVALTYQADQPYCGFPSLHVGSLTVIGMSTFDLVKRRPLQILFIFWIAFIAFSTLTTKQHVFWDLPGGIIFGLASVAVVRLIDRKRMKT